MSRPRPRRPRVPASSLTSPADLRVLLVLVVASPWPVLLVARAPWRVLAASPAVARLLGPGAWDALRPGAETPLLTMLSPGHMPPDGGWQTVGLRLPAGGLTRLEARLQPLIVGRRRLALVELRRPGAEVAAPATAAEADVEPPPWEENNRLMQIAAAVDAVLWEAEAATFRFTYVSARAESLLGYPLRRWLEEPGFWVNILHPEDRARAVEFCRSATEAGRDHVLEYRVLAADGRVVWLRDIVRVLPGPDGRPALLRGVMVDITERKIVEAALEASAAHYRTLMEQASDAIFVSFPRGTFIDVNTQACALLGYTRAELLTLTAADIVAPGEFASRPPRYDDLFSGRAVRVERRLRRKDGTLVPAEMSITRLTDGRLLAIVRDVSERTRIEQALRRRDAILSAVSAAATRLLGSACWEEHAEQVLAELGAAADVSRAYIDQNLTVPDGGLRCLRRFCWAAPGVRLAYRRLREQPFDPYALGLGRFARLLGSGAVLQGHVRDLQPAERALLEPQGIRSLLAVPVFVDERWWGTVIFDECREEREWSEAEVEALRLAARLIGAAIKRGKDEAALRASEQRFRMLAENAHDVIYRFSLVPTPVVEYVSPAVERTSGYRAADLLADPELIFRVVHPDDRPLLQKMLRGAHGIAEPVVLRWLSPDGTPLWMEHRNTAVYDADGRLVAIEGVARDVTETKRYEERLHRLAYYDPLTGLPNRAYLLEWLEQMAAARAPDHDVTVLLLDLDRFKLVNESLGHAAGDTLLQAVAERLRAALHPEDLLARVGEDEFAVLLASPSAPEAAAERLLDALAPPFTVDGRQISITASIGIVQRPVAAASAAELLRDALTALHQAKTMGRARWVQFDERVRARTVARFGLEHDLRRALLAGGLSLAYQPIVDVDTGRIVAVEALVRWQHPERGPVPAGEVIALAEDTGLIIPLGEWVLREACRQAVAWQRLAPDAPALTVGVNLSALQLRHSGLVASVRRVLAETGLAPSALCLEITESVALEGGEATVTTLQALKELGVRLALDDFGTGYSALGYLSRFAVDTLKVDRSFITDADRDPRTLSIVRAITAMAHALGMDVTAEGIETARQLAAVRAVGCDWGQGYHFSRPVSAAEVTALLQRGFLPAS